MRFFPAFTRTRLSLVERGFRIAVDSRSEYVDPLLLHARNQPEFINYASRSQGRDNWSIHRVRVSLLSPRLERGWTTNPFLHGRRHVSYRRVQSSVLSGVVRHVRTRFARHLPDGEDEQFRISARLLSREGNGKIGLDQLEEIGPFFPFLP